MKDTIMLCFSLSAEELIEFEKACQSLGLTWEEWFRQSLSATTEAASAASNQKLTKRKKLLAVF